MTLPWNADSLPSGVYRLHVAAPGYSDTDEEVLVEAGFLSKTKVKLWKR